MVAEKIYMYISLVYQSTIRIDYIMYKLPIPISRACQNKIQSHSQNDVTRNYQLPFLSLAEMAEPQLKLPVSCNQILPLWN